MKLVSGPVCFESAAVSSAIAHVAYAAVRTVSPTRRCFFLFFCFHAATSQPPASFYSQDRKSPCDGVTHVERDAPLVFPCFVCIVRRCRCGCVGGHDFSFVTSRVDRFLARCQTDLAQPFRKRTERVRFVCARVTGTVREVTHWLGWVCVCVGLWFPSP